MVPSIERLALNIGDLGTAESFYESNFVIKENKLSNKEITEEGPLFDFLRENDLSSFMIFEMSLFNDMREDDNRIEIGGIEGDYLYFEKQSKEIILYDYYQNDIKSGVSKDQDSFINVMLYAFDLSVKCITGEIDRLNLEDSLKRCVDLSKSGNSEIFYKLLLYPLGVALDKKT